MLAEDGRFHLAPLAQAVRDHAPAILYERGMHALPVDYRPPPGVPIAGTKGYHCDDREDS
jgi:hypothetical protein